MKLGKQRVFALFIITGISILLFRTLRMLILENALEVLILPLSLTIFIEMLIDFSCIAFSINWFIKNTRDKSTIALKLAATGVIFHSIRVLLYVLGRLKMFLNYDIREQYKLGFVVSYFWVYFAAIMSLLGIIGVFIVWNIRKKEIL